MSGDNKKTPPPQQPSVPSQPSVQSQPSVPSPTEETLTLPKSSFDDRLNRKGESAKKELLSSLGFESVDQLKKWKDEQDKLAEEAEQRRLQEMSDIERAQVEAKKAHEAQQLAEQKYQKAIAEKEEAETIAHIINVCASKNIKNTDYAIFRLRQAAGKLQNETDVIDENKFFDDLMENPAEKAALGLTVEPVQTQATTTTGNEPPPRADGNDLQFDAMSLSDEDWAKHKKSLGLE